MLQPSLLNIINQPCAFILVLLIGMASLGCTAQGNSQASNSGQLSSPLLQFQKAPCYGTCPAYEANIMEDGSITLISWGNIGVPEDDTVQLYLAKPELQKLKEDIRSLDYPGLQEAYLTDWSDWPSTYLTFYENGKTIKRVKHQKGGPERLIDFQDNLHQQIMELVAKQAKKD